MFFGTVSHDLFFLSYPIYHKSIPPRLFVPPLSFMSDAKISIIPSSVIHGCPTDIVLSVFKVIFSTFSKLSPFTSAFHISQPKFALAALGQRVKNIIFFLESKHTVPSFSFVLMIPSLSIDLTPVGFPVSSKVATKISMYFSPVIGSRPVPKLSSRLEPK